ncbi:adhesin [Pseudomonas fragi]|uniref:adhesin n=1 Tax=Pseudomonas fragi TaxID=296 RepID=UPI000B4DB945|nr:adhesin [Pseudomonas fragi]ASC85365.1 adhesin [Pseudomonas fragi]
MTVCRLPLLIAALVATSSALAASDNNATIDNSGAGYHGNVTVNQASGDQQQQVNVRAVAIGTAAKATTAVSQKITTATDPSLNARASIGGNSFSNGSGVIGINQSAGANNQMVNAVRIGISAQPQGVDDSALSQQNVALPDSGSALPASGSRQVVTGDQAFTGSRGVVQLNQSAGVGNRMANTLNLRVAD